MIYTVTLNPSIDYVVKVDELEIGATNRAASEQFYVGGKGINVSQVLKELHVETTALGFISGFTGKFIEDQLCTKGIKVDFVQLEVGDSRVNMKLKTPQNETEINGKGPYITEDAYKELSFKLGQLQSGDVLVLAGSLANGLPETFYGQVLESLQHKKIKVIVDTTKGALLQTLKYTPFLIKPNHHEVAELFGVDIKTDEALRHYGKKLREMGAQNVLISRGKAGAILITEQHEIYHSYAPKGILKNSVGAGDSMVAGFLAAYLKEPDYQKALQLGMACGSATAFSDGLAKHEDVCKLVQLIQVHKE